MMAQFIKFDISFFSVLLLLLMLLIMHLRKETLGMSNKFFKRIVWVNIYMLLLEILSWQFDRQPGQLSYYLNYFFNMLFAWSTPLITVTWACYIDYKIFGDIGRLKRRFYYTPVTLVATLLMGLNFFYPLIFSIDALNVYSREPFMWSLVALNSLVHFNLIYTAYKHRFDIQSEVVFAILLFICLPAVTAGFQVMIFGVFILWPMMAVTMVIVYIFLETVSSSKDYLTGLFSRFRVDQMVDHQIDRGNQFGVLMIDLNDFKLINDTLGHREGDKTLVTFAKALKEVFQNEKMVARYGGDEFLVVTRLLSEAQYKAYCDELTHLVEGVADYSIGYQGTESCDHVTYECMLNGADVKMYEQKKKRKLKKLK